MTEKNDATENTCTRYRIKDLPTHERPRERLRDQGAGALCNAELLAIILRTGTSKGTAIELAGNILSRFGSLANIAGLSVAELSKVHGLGVAKSAQILAALELGKRTSTYRDGARPAITCPEDVAILFRAELQAMKKEVLKLVILNSKNEVMKVVQISEGTLGSTALHPRETFREAIKEAAAGIVLAHNHPSGDPEPSADDVRLTREFAAAGKLIGIDLVDHIIIGAGSSFTSMKERKVF